MLQHHAFHETLMGILATQSMQLFPLSASLAVRFVKNASMCNATMQYPKVLNALLRSMTFSDVMISAPATEVMLPIWLSADRGLWKSQLISSGNVDTPLGRFSWH